MHASFEIADASSVAFARRGASDAAQRCALSETDMGRLALIVTEAATNILKHAQHGELLVRELPPLPASRDGAAPPGGTCGVEVLAIDRGPGIADVHAAFDDGRSTAGTPGTGLGAIRRLSEQMSIYSQPQLGTIVRATVRGHAPGGADTRSAPPSASGTDIGGVCVPYPGEMVCGDAWGVEADQHGLTVTVADGLGHGPDAHVAAAGAVHAVHRRAGRSPAALMQYAHDALRPTRGAAVAIARVDLARSQLSFAGTGNIAASVSGAGRPALVSGARAGTMPLVAAPSHSERSHWQLTSRNGIVGHTMRDAQEFEVPWTRNAMLILHSDGIGTRWDLAAYPGLHLQPAVMIAAVLYRDFARHRDDATVVVVKADQGVHFTHGNADTTNPPRD
ncbi:anti-sigma regulatory factor (Ser/Thr protein kinase) [Paraburkholderia rhizosphaerae]|uniref:Anti-sigma regulatory factor (Ser/Thr protein kinase) n=2 Tax=Paraburkholderia rhizosphaerae TaxID=480658 RepID=A0A4R8LQS5_9BURK|nr:anti-sigma regulatory factor (Ser/Thr protein kinase) [Paraburkholderia rhizosphaerae]